VSAYWSGNVAKHRAVQRIVADARAGSTLTVFDYGCGSGGDWPEVLREHAGIRLIGYDPDIEAAARARERMADVDAEIWGGDLPPQPFTADVIVSFSVLEHVIDRGAYLHRAHAHLAANGTFVLNYDDGHFRNDLRLEHPSAWSEPLRAYARHVAAPVRPTRARERAYVKRIPYGDLVGMVEQAGFRVLDDRMENLADLKAVAKFVPEHEQENFLAFWRSTEDLLNERLEAVVDSNGAPLLWGRMLSRTLVLERADA
jgi:SAM-dependent methyltransferase